jgi:hypothetical protein
VYRIEGAATEESSLRLIKGWDVDGAVPPENGLPGDWALLTRPIFGLASVLGKVPRPRDDCLWNQSIAPKSRLAPNPAFLVELRQGHRF